MRYPLLGSRYLVLHRQICAIPGFATYRAILVRYLSQKKKAPKCFAILSLQVSRDTKSIGAGPLSCHTNTASHSSLRDDENLRNNCVEVPQSYALVGASSYRHPVHAHVVTTNNHCLLLLPCLIRNFPGTQTPSTFSTA